MGASGVRVGVWALIVAVVSASGARAQAASMPASMPAAAAEPEPRGGSEPETEAQADLLARGTPGYYAVAYGADWAFVALSAGLAATGTWQKIKPPFSLLGPSFDDKDPDLAGLLDPRLDSVVGNPLVHEKVPVWSVAAASASAVLAAGVLDGFVNQDFHHTHSLVLGAAATMMATLDVAELLKLSFGRLRPDFRERYTRAACQGLVQRPEALDCASVNDGFELELGDYVDGYKSFPSGHSSTSFALATYLSLWLGSEWIWGEGANELSQPLATLAAGGLYAGALFVAASRVSDHRHHLEDVAVGAALGSALGAATWLLYFDLEGNARWRDLRVTPVPLEDGAAVSLQGRF